MTPTPPIKAAMRCAVELSKLLQQWFEVSIINPDTGKPTNEFVALFDREMQPLREAAEPFLSAFEKAKWGSEERQKWFEEMPDTFGIEIHMTMGQCRALRTALGGKSDDDL